MALETAQERHRASHLKQQNKKHKHGRHRSKGAVDAEAKGRVPVKNSNSKLRLILKKQDRRNQSLQNRSKKREDTFWKKRQLGTARSSPFLVTVLPLSQNCDVRKFLGSLEICDSETIVTRNEDGCVLHLSVPRFKQRFSFITPDTTNMYAVLDSLKVADTVLFLTNACCEDYIDELGELIFMSGFAQGLPSVVSGVLNLDEVPLKKRSEVRSNIQKQLMKWLPDEKLMSLQKEVDMLNLLRKIGTQKRQKVTHKDIRPHMLVEKMIYCEETTETGTLKVSGYLRGQPLSANSLVHIPGWGSYQIKQIEIRTDPHPIDGVSLPEEVQVFQVANPSKQESLQSENVVDEMDAEQTWPNVDDLLSAESEKKRVKKVPKGMSEYQACWIPDEDALSLDDSEEEKDDMDVDNEELSDIGECEEDEEEEEEEEEELVENEGENYDKTVDLKEEEITRIKIKQGKEDEMYPDEVDTPTDQLARVRFQKYRGLASFRTSPWDPKENLPLDYAKLFQFENFDRARKRVLRELEESTEGVQAGRYITVYVENVPRDRVASHPPFHPLVMYGMLQYEQKMSVINVVLKRYSRSTLSQIPIKSKEELVFECGYRRFRCKPIFSQHTNGNKHKYERYFQPDSHTVATFYAPIIFPPASVLVYKEYDNGKLQELVATGTVLSANPDRLIIKRVVLSGHPYKVNKKSAVIRFMFYNKEDIDWFKSVELRTKYGRRGHIRESLGTHGHMKCVFDGQLKSQDTVLLCLYKRVFPKWTYTENKCSSYKSNQKLPTIREEDEQEVDMC